MANVVFIPDGTTETPFTADAGDLLAPGDSASVDGAPLIGLEEANTALANEDAISATGAPTVVGDEAKLRGVNGSADPAASITRDTTAILRDPLRGTTRVVSDVGTIDGAFNGIEFQGATGSAAELVNDDGASSDDRIVAGAGANTVFFEPTSDVDDILDFSIAAGGRHRSVAASPPVATRSGPRRRLHAQPRRRRPRGSLRRRVHRRIPRLTAGTSVPTLSRAPAP